MSETPDVTTEEVLDSDGVQAGVEELALTIRERCGASGAAIVGIHTRGVTLARRVVAKLREWGVDYPMGTLDISLYRDDFDNHGQDFPKLESSDIPFTLDGSRVILFDEVIFTGRTIRAALDGLMDYGRPAKIELAVLVDRGHRELPIQPDYTGITVETRREQYVKVRFRENDDREGVFLITEK